MSAIAYDRIPPEHALRRLYEWDGLMAFVAAALGKERLYRYADPFGALNVAAMKEGDELFWHFDQTDFVVSIALRDAEQGGDRGPVRRVPMTPGTLLLFEARATGRPARRSRRRSRRRRRGTRRSSSSCGRGCR